METERLIVTAQDQSLFAVNFQANILHNGEGPLCFPHSYTFPIDSAIQVPRLLTTLSQGALFLSQMSIQQTQSCWTTDILENLEPL